MNQYLPILLNTFFILILIKTQKLILIDAYNDRNPLNQKLPECREGYTKIKKKTQNKAILCPMFRDEEGFLSEWIAYYQMHGFDHIILYDDSSIDKSLKEIQPWITSGFVSVRNNWTAETLSLSSAFMRNEFKKAMTIKSLLERECKLQAQAWGYSYFISVDIDEYVVPIRKEEAIVDLIHDWFTESKRVMLHIPKYNYQVTPHISEPVDLLTIEAYHVRMTQPNRMNYYMHVADKCAFRLNASDIGVNASEFIATCCNFHGCQGYDPIEGSKFCSENNNNLNWQIAGKGKKWMKLPLRINHYSRSLEKFALKQKTWKTASGEVKKGETSEQAASSYTIATFLSRNVGWEYDPIAVRYGCQLRELLARMTGERTYLRPGDMWYRNAEFGRHVGDPDKRGRYGRVNPPGFKYHHQNPYHYHGGADFNESSIGPNEVKVNNHTRPSLNHIIYSRDKNKETIVSKPSLVQSNYGRNYMNRKRKKTPFLQHSN